MSDKLNWEPYNDGYGNDFLVAEFSLYPILNKKFVFEIHNNNRYNDKKDEWVFSIKRMKSDEDSMDHKLGKNISYNYDKFESLEECKLACEKDFIDNVKDFKERFDNLLG